MSRIFQLQRSTHFHLASGVPLLTCDCVLAGAPQDLPAQGETSSLPLTSLTSSPDRGVGHRKCALPGIRTLHASTLADV